VFRKIGQVVLPLAVLALIAVGQWGGDVRAERDAAPAVSLDAAENTVAAQDETEQPTKKAKKSKKSKKEKKAEEAPPATDETAAIDVPHEAEFLANAFPPVIPDTEWHQEAWLRDDCLRCHETGVGDSPQIVHEGMAQILLKAKCRSCHVFIEGTPAPPQEETVSQFNANAFPPMIPASGSHRTAWIKDDCLLCHETGNSSAPIVVHEGLPEILFEAKCRSCHVQIRSDEASRKW
jgi:hypothetical protein